MNIHSPNQDVHFITKWMRNIQTSSDHPCTMERSDQSRSNLKRIKQQKIEFQDDQQIYIGKDANANLRALGLVVLQFYSEEPEIRRKELMDEAFDILLLQPSLFSLVYNCSYLEKLTFLEKKKYIEDIFLSISTAQNKKNNEGNFQQQICVCGEFMSWILRCILMKTTMKNEALNYTHKFQTKEIYQFICEILNIGYSFNEDYFFFQNQGIHIKCLSIQQFFIGKKKSQKEGLKKKAGRNRYFNLEVGVNFKDRVQNDYEIPTPTFALEEKKNHSEDSPKRNSLKKKPQKQVSSLLQFHPHECQSEEQKQQNKRINDRRSLNESLVIEEKSNKKLKIPPQSYKGGQRVNKKFNSELHLSERLYQNQKQSVKVHKVKKRKQYISPQSKHDSKQMKRYSSPQIQKKPPYLLYRSNYTPKSYQQKTRQGVEEKNYRNFPEFLQKKSKQSSLKQKQFDLSEIFQTQTLMKPKLYFKTENQQLNTTKKKVRRRTQVQKDLSLLLL